MSEPGSADTLHAFRQQTGEHVAVVLTDGTAVRRVVISSTLHEQIGDMLGLPKIGETNE